MKSSLFNISLIFTLAILVLPKSIAQNLSNVNDLYKTAENDSFSLKERKNAVMKGLVDTKNNENDTLRPHLIISLIKLLYKDSRLDSIRKYSDSLIIMGEIENSYYWQMMGYFNKGAVYRKLKGPLESYKSYKKALVYAKTIPDSINCAKILVNITNIQNDLGDHQGAQVSATDGLRYLQNYPESKFHYNLNLALGNAYTNLQDHKKAEKIYLNLARTGATPSRRLKSINNLANNYRKLKEFDKALHWFRTALEDSIELVSVSTVARLKDNYGFTLFQAGDEAGLELMQEALSTRIKNADLVGQFASYIHLTEFYLFSSPAMAKDYATEAYEIARQIKSPDAEKEALYYLLHLPSPVPEKFQRYAILTDSISNAKYLMEQKYAGVRFDVEQKEIENLRLTNESINKDLAIEKQKFQKWIFLIGLSASILLIVFLYKKFITEKKTKMLIQNQKLEIEGLHKELHHRLKNNLSFIDLFIGLAKGKFTDASYQERLNDLQNRINSMFQVHTQLFKANEFSDIEAKGYIETIITHVRNSYGNDNIEIFYKIRSGQRLTTSIAFPVGLIVNEFVTNSCKYAFPLDKGVISIGFDTRKDNYILQLSDNGVGLSEDFKLEDLNSFGLEAMKLLTLERGGTFTLKGEDGVMVCITLPIKTL